MRFCSRSIKGQYVGESKDDRRIQYQLDNDGFRTTCERFAIESGPAMDRAGEWVEFFAQCATEASGGGGQLLSGGTMTKPSRKRKERAVSMKGKKFSEVMRAQE